MWAGRQSSPLWWTGGPTVWGYDCLPVLGLQEQVKWLNSFDHVNTAIVSARFLNLPRAMVPPSAALGKGVSSAPLLASYSACHLIKVCSQRTYEKHKRSMIASDLLGELPNTFAEVFDKEWDDSLHKYIRIIATLNVPSMMHAPWTSPSTAQLAGLTACISTLVWHHWFNFVASSSTDQWLCLFQVDVNIYRTSCGLLHIMQT